MKKILLVVFVCINQLFCFGQVYESVYHKTLTAPTDTFYMRFAGDATKFLLKIKGRDTLNWGTDGFIDAYAVVYYGKDSVRFDYNKLPFKQVTYVTLQSPKGKTTLMVRFNDVTAAFPNSYVKENTGKVQFVIPETYELANIIWTLSPSGTRAGDLYKQSDYYKKVMAYFKPYLNHPIFKQLDFADSVYTKNYYSFRENSNTYRFKGDKLVWDGPYYQVFDEGTPDFTSLFMRLKPLIEDFARKSNFRAFYKNNQAFYAEKINREQQLMPVKSMWNWMEKQFPANSYQAYKVVFSPLIGGSHSTQNFTTGTFAEVNMYVCATDRYEKPEYTETEKQGLMSGVVFTEIDHNYINSVTRKYRKTVDSIFSKKEIWAAKEATQWYGAPQSVFNEYMTHAVFCLWVLDTYDKKTAAVVISLREDLMVNKRKFIKFKEFNQALITMHEKDKEVKVVNLYPDILSWSSAQVK
jgi:hypothetical protein